MQILIDDAFPGVGHHHGDLRPVERVEGLRHRELLHRPLDPAFAAHAGGVDQQIVAEGHVDGVTGGARAFAHDLPPLAKQTIDERGLADVGATDDGHAHPRCVPGILRRVFRRRQPGVGGVQTGGQSAPQRIQPAPVRGGDRQRVEAERGELGSGIGRCGIDLVDGHEHVRAGLAQPPGDALLAAGQARPGIGHQERELRFRQRRIHLLPNRVEQHRVVVRLFRHAAGVDQRRRMASEHRLAVAAIPR